MAGTRIHPTALIEGDVILGQGCEIGPYTVLCGPIRIGSNVSIGPHTLIGAPPEHRGAPVDGLISIADGTEIRDHVAIHHPRAGVTSIGRGCYIQSGVYIAHDCQIGDNVTLHPKACLAGHATVQPNAIIGMGASVHQWTTVGNFAMVGQGAAVVKNVHPFLTVGGCPIRAIGINRRQIKNQSGHPYEHLLANFHALRKVKRDLITDHQWYSLLSE